jgi:hypothetical protein
VRRRVIAAAACLGLAACSTGAIPPPQATLDNIQAVRAAGVAPMRVGSFNPGPDISAQSDKSISVRAGVMAAPDGSFARYLGSTLEAELKGAGKLDPGASLTVTGVMTRSHVDSAMPNAHGSLGATFTLTRGGQVVFDKALLVEDTWPSAFMGAEAIPDAENHYLALYPKLVGKLLADPEFKAAARP